MEGPHSTFRSRHKIGDERKGEEGSAQEYKAGHFSYPDLMVAR